MDVTDDYTAQNLSARQRDVMNLIVRRALLFLGLMAASLAALLLLPPITQDQSYHGFADERDIRSMIFDQPSSSKRNCST
jgi:hypothetical protein